MSKKRRSKSATNTNDMSNFNHEEDSAFTATEATTAEPAIEAAEESVAVVAPSVEAVEAVEAPVIVEKPAVAVPATQAVKHTDVPLDVLLGVFTKRVISSIDQALWESAVNAVRQGRVVLLSGSAPYIKITAETFNSDGKLPAGVSTPTSVLNNLLVGMV